VKARLLALFGRTYRVRSWSFFGIGAAGFVISLASAWPNGLDKLGEAPVTWLLVMFQGMDAAQAAENELDTEADADRHDQLGADDDQP
jgi:hypothetical protein